MTTEQLIEILSSGAADAVKSLQITSFPTLPKWSDLEPQYDPSQHTIWDVVAYPEKLNDNDTDDFKRTSLALQKLAVNRIAQAMFATPVQRHYNFDRDNQAQQDAIGIVEEIYKTQNYIDAENIERCKKLNASCQIATVWYKYDEENQIGDQKLKMKLAHKTYSEKDGYSLYPITDSYGRLLVMSIGYKDTSNVEYLDVYTNTQPAAFYRFINEGEWLLSIEQSNNKLEVFPVVYLSLPEPVWGGTNGTNQIEQLEEMESYQGLYIKRNALPTFTIDYGEVDNGVQSTKTDEKSQDSRKVIKVGKGGKMTDVTWKGAGEAVSARYERIRNAFFEENQIPDTSFANMISSNTSAENKELIFADAKAKAKDLGGEWERLFYDELNIVIAFIKVIVSSVSTALEGVTARSVIIPYSVKSKKENAEYVATGGTAMSLATKIKVLGEVDDIEQEEDAINEENGAAANTLL